MIRKLTSTFAFSCVFASPVFAAVCNMPAGHQLPVGMDYAYGPNVAAQVASNIHVQAAIIQGGDAWDGTDAVGRIGTHNSVTSANDCPFGLTAQIGAFNFAGTPCQTNINQAVPNNALAYSDRWSTNCPTACNTKSIIFNTNFPWSADGTPAAGEYDLRSVIPHEWGHSLGFNHQDGGVCGPSTNWCAVDSGKETMADDFAMGESCQADVTADDAQSANAYY